MALPGLIEALELEARTEAAAILEGARGRAEGYLRSAEARLDRTLETEAASREGALWREEERRSARRSRFLWRRLLLEREAGLARILDRARDRLPGALADERYRRSIGDQMGSVLEYVGDQAAEIRAPEALCQAIQDAVAARPRTAVVVDPDAGSGFRLVAGDGRLEVDATLERRLERDWPALRIELARSLEEGDAVPDMG